MRILLVVHGFPPAACGGTELYVHDLAVALARSGHTVSVLTRTGDPRTRELATRETSAGEIAVFSINNTFQACGGFEESYANPALREVVSSLLDRIAPDIVHVQHLTCLSTGIPEACQVRRIPVVMTLNDYWLICHRGQLLDRKERRCPGPFDGGCAECIPPGLMVGRAAYRAARMARSLPVPGVPTAMHLAQRALDGVLPRDTRRASLARLAHMRAAVEHVQLFFAPSETMAAQFSRFGIPPERLVRCTQGIDLALFSRARRRPASHLRVGFAGSLIPSKAPHVLLQAVGQLPSGTTTVDLLGAATPYHGDARYSALLEPFLRQRWVRKLGPVPHERMADAFSDLDVLVVPSIWIENAPFIIREAFAARVPVVASRLGGMSEMVRDCVDGLLFPPGDSLSLAAQLQRLAADRDFVEHLRDGIAPPIAIEEDAARLERVYAGLVGTRIFRAAVKADSPARTRRVHAVVLNYRTADQACIAVESLEAGTRQPDALLVVDNGSADGSDITLRTSLPRARVLGTDENLGFAAGCNIGIRAALEDGADLVLLVNSDVVLPPSAVEALVAVMDDDAEIGIAAPVLLSREEPDRVASAGISYSMTTGRMRHAGAGLPLSLLSHQTVSRVDAVSGCVMLIRRGVLDRAGLFDDQYYFSFEDIDLCLRARAEGYSVACVHDAVAYHEGARTIGRRSARRVYFATRNHLRLSARAAPAGAALRAPLIVALNAAYALLSSDAPLVSRMAAVTRGTWDHLRGRYGAGPSGAGT